MLNLMMPGNPRYQPKDLQEYWGYDNLMQTHIEVELATLFSLIDLKIVPADDAALLTPEVLERVYAITTTMVDKEEREVTKHDIRALVHLIQKELPAPLRRWVHVPLTSYDVIDTARVLQFIRAHKKVVRPKVIALAKSLSAKALQYADTPQVGRTHGQHALPITVGFWLATLLNRILDNLSEADEQVERMVGKISGAVGAFNAQHALGIAKPGARTFEQLVLGKLELTPAAVSTQILPPESIAYYLFACTMLSASIAQLGRDCRHLMRTEIGELSEPFDKKQVGSSTMAHKRNPFNFEGLEAMWLIIKNQFACVLDTTISEHQRDLVGSAVARSFPIIVINLVAQLDKLTEDRGNGSFIDRVTIDTEACAKNLAMKGDLLLAEPLYLMLQMYGYQGDAHELVNHRALPLVGTPGVNTLYRAVLSIAEEDEEVRAACNAIPQEQRILLQRPTTYTGLAKEKVEQVCGRLADYVA